MRRRAWKWILVVQGTMIFILGLLGADVHRRASAILERNRLEVAKKLSEFRARDRRRPSAYPEMTEGNAWDYYGPALKAIAAIPEELGDLVPEVKGVRGDEEDPPDEHALHNLFREYAPVLAAFEKGARCQSVDMPGVTFRQDMDLSVADMHRAATFLSGCIAHHHRLGTERDALPVALAGLALAQDYGRAGVFVCSIMQNVAEDILLDALQEVMESHSLLPEDLASFAAILDRLDIHRPDLEGLWTGEVLYDQSVLLGAEWTSFRSGWVGLGGDPKPPVRSWRLLFSQRIARAQALQRLPEIYRGLPALRPLPPWQRLACAPPELMKVPTFDNPLLASVASSIGATLGRDAGTLLLRTLLRVAVGLAWFEGEQHRYPLSLEDLVPRYLPKVPVCPLTGLPLRTKEGKVWSVGKNRVDDGGTPGTRHDVDDEDGDVVWTVKRK